MKWNLAFRKAAVGWLALAAFFALGSGAAPAEAHHSVTLVARDTPIAEVFEILSKTREVNIVIATGVTGNISVNLYKVDLDEAIQTIANAAGYVAERRVGGWAIITRDDLGQDSTTAGLALEVFPLKYADPATVLPTIENHLSRYGEVSALIERRMIVVEDRPDFLRRIRKLIEAIDAEPKQILLEARILEIKLDDGAGVGIDWSRTFNSSDGTATLGLKDVGEALGGGLFFQATDPKFEVAIEALAQQGRVRTLSVPKVLAIENQEAKVVIGDRLGFRVTTTINQVTTESVEFLESGVILRFTAAVDRNGRIVMQVHPEVSNGTLDEGLPNQSTTELSTTLVADDGQSIFIAGLINDRMTNTRSGIPYLMNIPYLGVLFSSNNRLDLSTETVVILTPTIVNGAPLRETVEGDAFFEDTKRDLDAKRQEMNDNFPGAPGDNWQVEFP